MTFGLGECKPTVTTGADGKPLVILGGDCGETVDVLGDGSNVYHDPNGNVVYSHSGDGMTLALLVGGVVALMFLARR